MRDGPPSLSRPAGLEDLDPDRRQAWPLWVKLLLVTTPLLAAGILALRWLDDTRPEAQVQVLNPLPPVDASQGSTSAMTYPFAKESSPQGEPATASRTAPPRPAKVLRTPPGITPERWQALVEELSAKPDGAAEIARLESYLHFSDAVRQFRELQRVARGAEPTAAVVALAGRIDAAVDIHLQRRELSGSEAYDIKAAVLEVLEPDPDALDDKLERWAESSLPRQNTDTDRAAMQRDDEFARRQAAIVAAWSSLPPQQRDPAALERDIANLRQEIYGPRGR